MFESAINAIGPSLPNPLATSKTAPNMIQLQISRNIYFHTINQKCNNDILNGEARRTPNEYTLILYQHIEAVEVLCKIWKEFSRGMVAGQVIDDNKTIINFAPNKVSWNDTITFWKTLYDQVRHENFTTKQI